MMGGANRYFGTLPNGKIVNEYMLTNKHGMVVKVINLGGIITSILAPDRDGNQGDVVLGFESLDEYINDTHYIGAIVGRTANRIAGASFTLDGNTYKLSCNNNTNNHHGGAEGFNKKLWNVERVENGRGESLKLTYFSKDGEEGFPGNLLVMVVYTLTDNNELTVDYSATTDKKTVVNLTQHSYFNLSAGKKKDILSHDLLVSASLFLATNALQVPTGELRDVANTAFDFRKSTRIADKIDADDEQIKFGAGIDHTWVVDRKLPGTLDLACTLSEEGSGRKMSVYTTEPGVQIYSGNYLDGAGKGKGGERYTRRYGIGLETQHFPNSPNQPSFPSIELSPGDTFRSQTLFKFETFV